MIDLDITTKGDVPETESDHARRLIGQLDRRAHDPVLGGRVVLRQERNPSLERPARAEAELNLNGQLLRGEVAAATMSEAIDQLAAHLQRQLRDFVDRRQRLARRANEPAPGEWRHGPRPSVRPAQSLRPAQERSIVRRKAFALGGTDPQQAVIEMLDLDHDFHLFRDAQTGLEALAYRRDDGRIGLIHAPGAPPSGCEGLVCQESRLREPISIDTAISEMDALGHRFLFFVDEESGRGNVIYLRYDGDYGLIQPAR